MMVWVMWSVCLWSGWTCAYLCLYAHVRYRYRKMYRKWMWCYADLHVCSYVDVYIYIYIYVYVWNCIYVTMWIISGALGFRDWEGKVLFFKLSIERWNWWWCISICLSACKASFFLFFKNGFYACVLLLLCISSTCYMVIVTDTGYICRLYSM